MLIKFKKDYGVAGGKLYFSGQVAQIDDEKLAQKLVDDGVAQVAGLFDSETKGKKGKPVTPQTDPELVVTPTVTGKAAALVAADNAILDRKLAEKRAFRENAESWRPKPPVLDYEIRAAEAAKKETEALNKVEENAKPADEDFEATLDYEIRAELAARKENVMATHKEAEAIQEAEAAESVGFEPDFQLSHESDNDEIMATTDTPPVKVSKPAKVQTPKATSIKVAKPKIAKAKK